MHMFLPSLSAPASPRMTVTGLAGLVQNWWRGGKKASLLFSSCKWAERKEVWGKVHWKHLRRYECFSFSEGAQHAHKYWELGGSVCPLAVEERVDWGAAAGDTCPGGCCWSTDRSFPDSCTQREEIRLNKAKLMGVSLFKDVWKPFIQ